VLTSSRVSSGTPCRWASPALEGRLTDNVRDRLPERLRSTVAKRMRAAYHADSVLDAEAQLTALARELDKTHPGAAPSLREGLEETLTVLRLGLPPTLARTFRSTNAIESMISICRDHVRNVKHWRDGQMALRWSVAGMLEAGKQFRRVKRSPASGEAACGARCRNRRNRPTRTA